jgi:hypothetical protein
MQTLTLDFADGEYPFLLSVTGSIELQEKCKAGFGAIFGRVCHGVYFTEDKEMVGFPLDAQFHVDDLLNTIRLGLIGGGLDPIKAKRLVEDYCYPAQPMKGTWELAAAILMASMEGYKVKTNEEPVKKKRVTRTRKGSSTQETSSPTSPQ